MRVGIYTRVSTQDQKTLPLQLRSLRKYAKALHSAGKLFIGRCDCGELGCGSISVDVSRSGSQVEWSMPQTPGTIVVFETAQYDKAIQSGATDVSWETVEKTAERMIGQMDFSSCSHLGLTFRWACPNPA